MPPNPPHLRFTPMPSRLAMILPSLLVLVGAVKAPAQTDAPTTDLKAAQAQAPAEPALQDRAVDTLTESLAFYQQLGSVQVQVKSVIEVQSQGANQKMEGAMEVAVDRPNRFFYQMTQGLTPGLTMASDGQRMTVYMPPFDGHVIKDAPESMQLSMRQPEDQMMAQDLGLLAMRLVMQDQAVDRIVPMIAMARYLGQEQVEGVDCHKLLLRYKTQELSVEGNTQQLPPIDMRLWIEQGDRPLIHKIEPHIKKLLGAMPGTPPGLQQMEVSYTIRLTDYQVNPKIPDARFDYAPPAGSTQSASVQEALEKAQKAQRQAQQAQQQPQAGVQALEGQQAPGFELPKLGADQPVSLAQHKGEHVVVLDFWATWCPPCVEGLPKVEQVTRKFHDQGVRLYAVNLREGADKIRQFLEQQGLDVPVLLDREGAVAELYQVRGIPTTVVIGKDGTVQGVHVGLVPGEQIEKDLQKALAAADKPAE